jgi:hypothetical protein
MKRVKVISAVFLTGAPVHRRDSLPGKERAEGMRAEGDDQSRLYQIELTIEIHAARSHLVRSRSPIFERSIRLRVCRPVLHHIGNIDVLALQSRGREKLGEERAGRPDERAALLVFVTTRSLANQHDSSICGTFTGNSTMCVAVQVAALTGLDFVGELL